MPAEAPQAVPADIIHCHFHAFYPRAEFIFQWRSLFWLAINRGSFTLFVAKPPWAAKQAIHTFQADYHSSTSNPKHPTPPTSHHPPLLSLYAPLPRISVVFRTRSLPKRSSSCICALIIPPYKACFYSAMGRSKWFQWLPIRGTRQ